MLLFGIIIGIIVGLLIARFLIKKASKGFNSSLDYLMTGLSDRSGNNDKKDN